MNQTKFTLGELFCGPGGLALGAMKARVEKDGEEWSFAHGWSSDYDRSSCDTYIRNICPGQPETVFCEDVRKMNIEKLPAADGFAYGFPCNDFSIVGKQKGFQGEFGPLYSYGVKYIEKAKPKFFLAENVGGITSANDGEAFRAILGDLARAGDGYRLTVHLYKAQNYGVPQTRHRVIIVGIRKDLNRRFAVPAPVTKERPVSVREAFEKPPIPLDAPNNEVTRQSAVVVERLERIRPGENIWTADLPKRLQLNVKGAKLSQIYRRLHPDKPSYTITGSGGGGTHGYHYAEPRALTNRERARIQTFPDDFVFEGSKESVRKQIGMAVPVELSRRIYEAVLKTLAGIEYETADSNLNDRFDVETL